MTENTRTVHCEDAIEWLGRLPGQLDGCSFVTSLPDLSEFPGKPIEEWKQWFIETARLILSRCPDDGVAIFYQTDLRKEGAWIEADSKPGLKPLQSIAFRFFDRGQGWKTRLEDSIFRI